MDKDLTPVPPDVFSSLGECLSANFGISLFVYNENTKVISYRSDHSKDHNIRASICSYVHASNEWRCVLGKTSPVPSSEVGYVRRINDQGDCMLVYSSSRMEDAIGSKVEEEEEIYHELSVVRDIHFTLSSLMSHSFISIDCVSLRLIYSTTDFAAVCGFSLSSLPTLPDLCCLPSERISIERMFGELSSVHYFTLRFSLHIKSRFDRLLCYQVYCVRVPMYHDAVLALIDATQEEHDRLCVEAYKKRSSDSILVIVCDNNDEVVSVWNREGDDEKKSEEWIGEKLRDIRMDCNGNSLLEMVQGNLVKATQLKNGIMIELTQSSLNSIPCVRERNPLSEMLDSVCMQIQQQISEEVTPEEALHILVYSFQNQGKQYNILKQTSRDVVEVRSTMIYAGADRKQRGKTREYYSFVSSHSRSMYPKEEDERFYDKQMSLLWYLNNDHRAKLLSCEAVTIECPEIHAILTKCPLSPNLFAVEASPIEFDVGDLLSPESLHLISVSSIPMLLVSSTFRVEYVNQAAEEQLKMRRGSCFTHVFSDECREILETLQTLTLGQSTQFSASKKGDSKDVFLVSYYALSSDSVLVTCTPYQPTLEHNNYLQNSLQLYSLENTRLKRIMNIAFDGNCVIELQRLTVLYPSYSIKHLFDCEERGSSFVNFIKESYREEFRQKMRELNEKGFPLFDYHTILIAHGQERYYNIVAIPIQLTYQYYSQAILCIKDITRNIELEREEKQLNEAIERMNTLQSAMIQTAFNGSCILDLSVLQPLRILHAFDPSISSSIFSDEAQTTFTSEFREHLLRYASELHDAIHGIRIALSSGVQLEINMVGVENNKKAMITLRDITQDVEREEREIRLREEAQRANKNKRDFIVSDACWIESRHTSSTKCETR